MSKKLAAWNFVRYAIIRQETLSYDEDIFTLLCIRRNNNIRYISFTCIAFVPVWLSGFIKPQLYRSHNRWFICRSRFLVSLGSVRISDHARVSYSCTAEWFITMLMRKWRRAAHDREKYPTRSLKSCELVFRTRTSFLLGENDLSELFFLRYLVEGYLQLPGKDALSLRSLAIVPEIIMHTFLNYYAHIQMRSAIFPLIRAIRFTDLRFKGLKPRTFPTWNPDNHNS